MWVSKLNCIIRSRLCLSRLESPVVQVNLRKLHRKVPVKPTVVCLKTLKHYSPTVAEGKTFVLFFCYSVQSIHCCRRLGVLLSATVGDLYFRANNLGSRSISLDLNLYSRCLNLPKIGNNSQHFGLGQCFETD